VEPDADFLSLAGKIQAWEKWLVALLLALLFLANLAIASRSPWGGWMDEVGYTDPGLNLAAGKGWVSSVWRYQTDREFSAPNSPLYPAGLSVWARLFGVSMVSARAHCYFLGMVGLFLLWLGTFRLKLLTPGYRLLWLVFLAMDYGTNWMMRNNRYDVWIFVGLGLAWVGASLRKPVLRYGLIFLGCYLSPWAGFISLTYLCLLAGLAAVLTGFRRWREAVTAVVAAVAGMFSVLGFYSVMGVLQPFYSMIKRLSVAGPGARSSAGLSIFLFWRWDYGIALMIVALAVLSLWHVKKRSAHCLPWIGLGGGVVVLMPCLMLARGIFPTMYFYMLVIPLSLAILVLAVQAGRGWLARGVLVLVGLLCFTGLPARMYTSWKEWDYRDPRHIRDFVRTYLRPEDRIYTDELFYFEVRDYVRWYSAAMYDEIIPPDEAARVNAALVLDSEFPDLTRDSSPMQAIGGGWTKVAVFPTAEMRARLKYTPRLPNTYTLYRRKTAPP
jgi:hypothetical protein